jgi:hypothetical protein
MMGKGFAWVALVLLAALAMAAETGEDNASADTYAKAWTAESNGKTAGDAFSPWRLQVLPEGSPAAGAEFALGDSKTLGDPGADINANGKAFALLGKRVDGKDVEAAAFREFNGGGLSVGQTFAVDLAVNYRNGFKGIDVRSGTDKDNDRKNLFTFNTGGDDYVVSNAASNNGSVGNEYKPDTFFHVELTQTSPTGGTWKITRNTGGEPSTGTYNGVPTGFKLYCSGTDGTRHDGLFANNLRITK